MVINSFFSHLIPVNLCQWNLLFIFVHQQCNIYFTVIPVNKNSIIWYRIQSFYRMVLYSYLLNKFIYSGFWLSSSIKYHIDNGMSKRKISIIPTSKLLPQITIALFDVQFSSLPHDYACNYRNTLWTQINCYISPLNIT